MNVKKYVKHMHSADDAYESNNTASSELKRIYDIMIINLKITLKCTHLAISCHIRVESGSDDPDNVGHLGHFFEGSSGSHPQTKLSGCDPDILVATSGVC